MNGVILFLPSFVTSPPLNVYYSTSKIFRLSSLPSITSGIFLMGHISPAAVYALRIRSTMSQVTNFDLVLQKSDLRSGNYKIRATYSPQTFTIFGTVFSRSQ